MDPIKRFFTSLLPKNMIPATAQDDVNFQPITANDLPPVAQSTFDLQAPENTGFRNLLATINQNRDPETLQIDPRRMQDNMSFAGMNKQPLGVAPRIDMMPEQMARIPDRSIKMDSPVTKPKIEQTKGTLTPKDKSVEQKTTDPVVEEKIQEEMDILAKLGLSTNEPMTDQEMLNAQEAVRNNRLLFGMAKAGEKIGTSIAGVQSDAAFGDAVKDMVDQPVAQLKEGRAAVAEKEKRIMEKSQFALNMEKSGVDLERAKLDMADENKKRDPNSELSKAMRNFIRQQGSQVGLNLGINDSFSYAQLEKLNGSLTNLFNTKMASDSRKDTVNLMKSQKQEAKNEKKELQVQDLRNKLRNEIEKNDDKTKYSESLLRYKDLQERITSRQFNSVDDIKALYAIIKALDPESVVRESETKLMEMGQSGFQTIMNTPTRFFKGNIFTPEYRKSLVDGIGRLVKQQGQRFHDRLQPRLREAEKYNIDPKSLYEEESPIYAFEKEAFGASPFTKEKVETKSNQDDVSKMTDDELEAEAKRLGIK